MPNRGTKPIEVCVTLCLLLSLTSLALAASDQTSRGPSSVFRRVDIATSDRAHDTLVADFNRDGIPDIAVVSQRAREVQIYFGQPGGGYVLGTRIGGFAGPNAFVAKDFNRDGNLDLAITDSSQRQVSIYLGDGAGNFLAGTALTVPINCLAITSEDFNGDGIPDLAVTVAGLVSQPETSVLIFLANGNGTFSQAPTVTVGLAPVAIEAADLNRDGFIDLVVANNRSGGISVVYGDGSGKFSAATNYPTGALPNGIAIADLDHDGILDLAVANAQSENISILKGSGTGFTVIGTLDSPHAPGSLVAADFRGTGNLDLVVANAYSDDLSYFSGNGNGTFNLLERFTTGLTPVSVRKAVFANDNIPDLIVGNADSDWWTILYNRRH